MKESVRVLLLFYFGDSAHATELINGDRYTDVARGMPIAAPLVGVACGALYGCIGIGAMRVGLTSLVSAALTMTAFSLIRGVRLIDGFCDLSEGLSYAAFRNGDRERVWHIIRSPQNGSFAILWTCVVFILQLSALEALLRNGAWRTIGIFAACGAFSEASAVFVHGRSIFYREDSTFSPFGYLKSKSAQFLCLLGCGVCCSGIFLLLRSVSLLILLLLAATIGASRLLEAIIFKRLGSYNGDVFGFVPLTVHTILLVCACAFVGVVP